MNCKPGDLAVIVRSNIKENIGHLVTVLDDFQVMHGHHCWLVRSARPLMAKVGPVDVGFLSCAYMPDKHLRPIRDPGEGAQDETLSWLPVPEKEGVTA